MFEGWFGVVELGDEGKGEEKGEAKVRALGSWDTEVTVTDSGGYWAGGG